MNYFKKENGSVGFTTQKIPAGAVELSESGYMDALNAIEKKIQAKVLTAIEKASKGRGRQNA